MLRLVVERHFLFFAAKKKKGVIASGERFHKRQAAFVVLFSRPFNPVHYRFKHESLPIVNDELASCALLNVLSTRLDSRPPLSSSAAFSRSTSIEFVAYTAPLLQPNNHPQKQI